MRLKPLWHSFSVRKPEQPIIDNLKRDKQLTTSLTDRRETSGYSTDRKCLISELILKLLDIIEKMVEMRFKYIERTITT